MDFFNNKVFQKKAAKWVIGVVTACLFIYLLMRYVSPIVTVIGMAVGLLTPLLVGVLIALILDIPMYEIEKRLFAKSPSKAAQAARRPLSIVISLLLVIGVIALVGVLIIPEFVSVVMMAASMVGDFVNNTAAFIQAINWSAIPFGEELSKIEFDWNSLLKDFESWFASVAAGFRSGASRAISGATGFFANLFLGLIFAIYILASKERVKAQFGRLAHAWLPGKADARLKHVINVCGQTFRLFIVGQAIEAVVLGTMCTVGMLILQLPYAPMIGALVCVTSLIPYVGGLIGGAVGAFMIAVTSPIQAVVFVVFLVIIQQIEGNVIYPRVVGAKISLPSLWVFAAITVGAGVAGAFGMLMAVPIAASAYKLLREATEEREAKRANSLEGEGSQGSGAAADGEVTAASETAAPDALAASTDLAAPAAPADPDEAAAPAAHEAPADSGEPSTN